MKEISELSGSWPSDMAANRAQDRDKVSPHKYVFVACTNGGIFSRAEDPAQRSCCQGSANTCVPIPVWKPTGWNDWRTLAIAEQKGYFDALLLGSFGSRNHNLERKRDESASSE